ncbi:alpha/beta fold hydrolase [Mycobacterium paraterrae]|uniref:Alpha/beta hydrolase n=1 Tax=Mycobacterium paraterrae TaxID=577492 RepID=A0ABY3VH00_9MYCO|nr:alpha/beta hydrolase [Mycobacterium paraterrae]UMB68697.1 alpha/beta hydrolase [Mycobacterium paraterrae]
MVSMVHTRAGQVAYSDVGEGPVVVLLHATLHDRHDFDAIVPVLTREHRVITLDWPGHGDSPAPNRQPSAALFADVLVDVVAELDLPPAAFVGNSVGGFAAARLAITDPQRVSRLILVNTGGFVANPVVGSFCRLLGTPSVMKRVLPRSIRSYMKATSDNDLAIQERALARARTPEGVALAAALWRSFAAPEHNLRRLADRITAPCLIIWGSQDTVALMPFGRATAAAIPGAQFEVLPTGHVVFSSDPAGFLALALPFLAASNSVQ